jgi:anti-anti-sigma factor
MQIHVTRGQPFARAVTVTATGELDVLEVKEFQRTVVGCCGPEVGVVMLDLSGITFLGSLGIATLRCWNTLDAQGVVLSIDRYSDAVERVLSAVGLIDHLAGPEDSESVG